MTIRKGLKGSDHSFNSFASLLRVCSHGLIIWRVSRSRNASRYREYILAQPLPYPFRPFVNNRMSLLQGQKDRGGSRSQSYRLSLVHAHSCRPHVISSPRPTMEPANAFLTPEEHSAMPQGFYSTALQTLHPPPSFFIHFSSYLRRGRHPRQPLTRQGHSLAETVAR